MRGIRRGKTGDARRANFGDVIEFRTAKGLAYAQYAHDDPRGDMGYGELLRVLPGLHAERPESLGELVELGEQFWSFANLDDWLKSEPCEVVAHAPVPEHARKFPLMRAPGLPDRSGRVSTWWLRDAKREWEVGELRDEHRDLSVAALPTYGAFVADLEEGYTPRDHPEGAPPAALADAAPSPAGQVATHYLYFESRAQADAAMREVAARGYDVEVEADDDDWVGRAAAPADGIEDVHRMEDELTRIAERHGAEYDGFALEVGA